MCIVIDTDTFGDFLRQNNPDFRPVWRWVNKKGKIAYCPTGSIKKEMKYYIKRLVSVSRELQRSNMVKYINVDDFSSEERMLLECKNKPNYPAILSDDIHIIALAKAANVKVLVTNDKTLMTDFKNYVNGGKTVSYTHLTLPTKRIV